MLLRTARPPKPSKWQYTRPKWRMGRSHAKTMLRRLKLSLIGAMFSSSRSIPEVLGPFLDLQCLYQTFLSLFWAIIGHPWPISSYFGPSIAYSSYFRGFWACLEPFEPFYGHPGPISGVIGPVLGYFGMPISILELISWVLSLFIAILWLSMPSISLFCRFPQPCITKAS